MKTKTPLSELQRVRLDEYVRANDALITKLCRRMARGPEEVDELKGAVLLRLCNRIGDFDPQRGTMNTFLGVVVLSVAMNFRKRDQRKPPPIPLAESPHTPDMLVSELPSGFEVLNPREREILLLLYDDGYSAAEVGKKFGVTAGSIRTYAMRAKAKLRRHAKTLTEVPRTPR